ncbi:MAG: xanthine dehydrogenase family protein molybdopterin-binding subunit, partial [Abitibacteriaceae bacterium]|nr:xanthine dehydrogenase family protein molybdopterin-binding subunit [Abditibacteriaceae bacterium]
TASQRPPIEPERYELYAPPTYQFTLVRRDFFKVLGGGLVVLCLLPDTLTQGAEAQESGGGRRRGGGNAAPQDIGAWLHIGEDGQVTVYTGKVEVGQNIRTSLTQVVAEELHAPVSLITMVMADTDVTPYDMGTFGSRTTPTMSPQLRKAAAAAREALLDLAAQQWQVERSLLVVSNGKVTHSGTQQTANFGQLTKGQQLVKTIEAADLTPADHWKVAGQSVPKVDGRSIVTGKHQFAADVQRPGMLYGKVLRPAAFNATLSSLDTKQADTMAGVKVVRDGDFVGVTAPNSDVAENAIDALKADWKTTSQPSSAELFDYLKKTAKDAGNPAAPSPIADAFSGAEKKLEATYTVAYIAHAPLEPRAAVAEWSDGKLTVWTGTQRPFGVRGELANAFGIPESQVRVIVPDTGSGYGGKHTGEAAVEAARLAKAVGKPVKLVWTREEEFTWAYFRPAGVIDVTSGVSHDGTLTAWEFHNYNSGGSGIETPYEVPHKKIEFHQTQAPLRQGSYRGLAATANHFARESHMDELAHTLNLDPLEFRLKNLKDARLRAVLEAAASRFGWGKTKPAANHGFGIAGGNEKGGYVATCAEVAIDRPSGRVKVVRAVTTFECGAVINPDHLKNQVEGATMMGIGGALTEAIEFADGKITNPHFARYRVPRFADAPTIEVVLLDRKDLPPAGAGETPIVAIAPAIGNAIFDAVGVRLRSLPMAPKGVKLT